MPQVDPASWTLRVSGLVDDPFEITLDELLALPLVEHHLTLTCVSNEVGGNLVGNARWLGYPVRELLARAGVQDGADMVLSTSADGWTASTPLDALTDPDRASLLAVGMNGEALPAEHGFPARLVVPGLYGYVSATKWVTELTVTTFADDVAYWSTRGWSERGPIKLASRVDTPRDGAAVDAGTSSSRAWRGPSTRASRASRCAWTTARGAPRCSPPPSARTRGGSGRTRGTRRRGAPADGPRHGRRRAHPDGRRRPPAPDGASGWHEVAVRVR